MPTPSVPGGPLARWLRHPGATENRWWNEVLHTLVGQEQHAVIAVGICAAMVLAAVLARRAARAASLRRGHWLHIDPPAQPPADGGTALWRQLAPLLTSRGTLGGTRPPVALEWLADTGRLRVGLWCSVTVGVTAVTEAVQTAWPGAQLTGTKPTTLLPGHPSPSRTRTSCARVRLALPQGHPFVTNEPSTTGRGDSTGDPLRGLLAALASPPAEGRAVLQVLVRPATGRSQRRARRAALALRTGTPVRSAGLRLRPTPGAGAASGQVDPIAVADARAITGKLTDAPLFEVEVRVAVTTPAGRDGRRARNGWLRHVAGALGLYSGRQRLLLTPARHAHQTINRRQPGSGFLASLHEIAALAHLPAEPSRYGMAIAPARAVPAPAGLTDA